MPPKKPKLEGPRGKATNIWLHEADLHRVRELASYISARARCSDSQVIRAALTLAKPNEELYEAFLKARDADGRRK